MDNVFLEELDKLKNVEKYNLTEVKTFLDDAVRKTLNEGFKCNENHRHMDIKLVVGYIGALISGVVALFNWMVPFQECKNITAVGVVLYFITNAVFMYYTWFIERNTIYCGSKNNVMFHIGSTIKPYSPVYELDLVVSGNDAKGSRISVKKPIGQWFDLNGKLVSENFLNDLQTLMKGVL